MRVVMDHERMRHHWLEVDAMTKPVGVREQGAEDKLDADEHG